MHFIAQCFPLCRLSASVVVVTLVAAALSMNMQGHECPHQCGISDEWFVGGIVTPTLSPTTATKYSMKKRTSCCSQLLESAFLGW